MTKEAIVYFVRVAGERLIGLCLFLAASGWVLSPRAAWYFGFYFAMPLLSALLLRRHGSTLKARASLSRETPAWDKIILTLFWLIGYFIIYSAAGSSCRAQRTDLLFWIGMLLYLLSTLLTDLAIASNPFAESTARIQTERGQQAVSAGPYRFIRHPMYAAILLWCIAVVLAFPTISVACLSAAVAVLILLRTALEDRMLLRSLTGYRDYASRTRFRILPGVW